MFRSCTSEVQTLELIIVKFLVAKLQFTQHASDVSRYYKIYGITLVRIMKIEVHKYM